MSNLEDTKITSNIAPNVSTNFANGGNNYLNHSSNYSSYFLEKGINNVVMNFLKGYNTNTIGGIFLGIGILIGADILKNIVTDYVKEQKRYIIDELIEVTKYLNIIKMIKYTSSSIFNIFNNTLGEFNKLFNSNKLPDVELSKELDKYNICPFELETNNLFLSNLITYIEDNKNQCFYNKIDDKKFMIVKNKVINKYSYSNIKIPYFETIININSTINYDNENIYANIDQNSFLDELIDKYINLIDDEFFNKYSLVFEFRAGDILFNLELFNKTDSYEDIIYTKLKLLTNDLFHCILVNLLFSKKYKYLTEKYEYNLLEKKTIAVIIIIINLFRSESIIELDKLSEMYKNFYKKIYNTDAKLKTYQINKRSPIPISAYRKIISKKNISDIILIDLKKNSEKITKEISETDYDQLTTCNYLKKKDHRDSTKQDLKITIHNTKNDLYLNEDDQIIIFKKFISQINNLSLKSDDKKKIKIYLGKVITKITKISKKNPEYDNYMKKKKELVEKNITDDKIINLLGLVPNEQLEENIFEKEVNLTYINEKYTSFSNLYLANSQDLKLKSLLNSFNDDKEKLESLGIPNKLCLLLYGEPGTGKTTTITTIASYFKRDIFYISLKNISNCELKMLFDHVNEKHSNKGIIVLEDFDAMTNVLSKRKIDEKYSTTFDIVNDTSSDLTLDFFLNILDGTLTSNDSIVIMTTNHLEKIDPAIYRAGRVDLMIEMKKSDHTQIKKMFRNFISRDIDQNVLDLIEEYKYTPAEIIFRLKDYLKLTNLTDQEILHPFITEI